MAAVAVVVQFGVFKYFYPFTSYIHGDSFVYLDTAYNNKSINTYMIGYSMFLRFFSTLSTSDLALAAFQYVLIVSSALFFSFTVFYFYCPRKWSQVVLLTFMIGNPLFIYLGNLVSSDGLFLAISLIWTSVLIFLINKPSLKLIIWHTLIIYIAFTIRYNALIYLFIASFAFAISKQALLLKTIGVGLASISIGIFILNTGTQYKNLTGIWQYSPFAGWQLANNAMYAYRYVDSAERKPVPLEFRALDNNIRAFFDSTRNTEKYPSEAIMASTYYMWSPSLPLFNFRNLLYKKDTTSSELKKWAMIAPFYKRYGIYIITHYPKYFLKYYIWPNAIKYYTPPVEFLGSYNSGRDDVAPIAQIWFHYKSRKVFTRAKPVEKVILGYYPIISGTVNAILFFCLISFILLNDTQTQPKLRKGILLGGTIWLLNAVFTISSSSAALRFQSFPFILALIFSLLLIDWMWQLAVQKSEPLEISFHPKPEPQ